MLEREKIGSFGENVINKYYGKYGNQKALLDHVHKNARNLGEEREVKEKGVVKMVKNTPSYCTLLGFKPQFISPCFCMSRLSDFK